MNLNLFTALVARWRYRPATSIILAHNKDETNWRSGITTFLCRTADGRYFLHVRNNTPGAVHHGLGQDSVHDVNPEHAARVYSELPHHEVPFEQAFPGTPGHSQ